MNSIIQFQEICLIMQSRGRKMMVNYFFSFLGFLFLFPNFAFGDLSDAVAAYKKNEFKKAFKMFFSYAQEGDVTSQFNLGCMYQNGEGVEVNLKEALKWYRLAEKNGHKPTNNIKEIEEYLAEQEKEKNTILPPISPKKEALKTLTKQETEDFSNPDKLFGLVSMEYAKKQKYLDPEILSAMPSSVLNQQIKLFVTIIDIRERPGSFYFLSAKDSNGKLISSPDLCVNKMVDKSERPDIIQIIKSKGYPAILSGIIRESINSTELIFDIRKVQAIGE